MREGGRGKGRGRGREGRENTLKNQVANVPFVLLEGTTPPAIIAGEVEKEEEERGGGGNGEGGGGGGKGSWGGGGYGRMDG